MAERHPPPEGSGLVFPRDLDAWLRWQSAGRPARRLLDAVRSRAPRGTPAHPPFGMLALGGPEPDLLVTVEATHASFVAAVLAPLRRLPQERVAVLFGPGPAAAPPPGLPEWVTARAVEVDREQVWDRLRPRTVLAAGHYTAAGSAAWQLARSVDAEFVVAQHGLLTPFAPPLPPDTHLAAWSRADADFWTRGRDDVRTTIVGSQLLWDAAQVGAAGAPLRQRTPVYLGQLHAAELRARDLAAAARRFCLQHDATYRPHPSERDRLSRLQHWRWQRAGMHVEESEEPLTAVRRPVVGVFSTGVLEAAAAGLPAWVDFPDPPRWLEMLWERHGLRRFDAPSATEVAAATPAPPRPEVEPAVAIADLVAR